MHQSFILLSQKVIICLLQRSLLICHFQNKSRTKKQKETNYNPYQDYFTACKSRNTLTRGSKTRPNFNDKYATGLKYSSLFSENLMHSLDMTYSIQDSDFSLTRDLCINSSDEVIFECKSKMMESLKKKAREIKRDSKRKKNKYARDIATNSKSKKTISVVEFMRNLNKNQIHHYCYMLSKNGDFLKKSSSVNLRRSESKQSYAVEPSRKLELLMKNTKLSHKGTNI